MRRTMRPMDLFLKGLGVPIWLVLLATWLAYQSPTPILLHADDTLRFAFEDFHALERSDAGQPYRWTNGSSTFCIAAFGHAPRSAVAVTVLGEGALPLGIDRARLLVNGEPLGTLPLQPATRRYRLLLDEQTPGNRDICLTIASPTVQPPGELRPLGVPFQAAEVRRLTLAGSVGIDTRLQVANLLLMLLAYSLLCLAGVRWWLASWLVTLVVIVLGVGVWLGVLEPGIDLLRNIPPLLGGLVALAGVGLGWRFSAMQQRAGRLPWLNNLLVRDLVAMGVASLLLCGAVSLLQEVHGRHGVWPLKAGVWPGFNQLVIIPIAFFFYWLVLLLARLRRTVPGLLPVFVLLLGAVALPLLLKTSVRGWDTLFETFRDSPSDYIRDVALVGNDPVGFLRSYVERSPDLAWHNSNHPPGSVLLLWGVERLFGPGPVPATWVAIGLSSLLPLAGYWLGQRLGGQQLALLTGALLVVMPVHQVYSVTSMDSLFNGLNALAAIAFFLAMQPGARPRQAVLAGALIALGLFFTFATTQLFFFGVAVCLLELRRQPLPGILQQGSIVVVTLIGIALLVNILTGFDIAAASIQASANNARLLTSDPANAAPHLPRLPTLAHYTYYVGVNIAPFAWYLAPWGLAALAPVVAAGVRNWRAPESRDILAVGLLALVVGMWLSGLFVREVERIWGFAYPLAAVLMALHIWQGETPSVRLWRAGLYIVLFFAQSVVMRLLLNTYW